MTASTRPVAGNSEGIAVAFLYTWDWGHEFAAFSRGEVPSHRLFGAAELGNAGMSIQTCSWQLVPKLLRRPQLWKMWQALWLMARPEINCAVATTEASALFPLALRWLLRRRLRVVVLTVAALDDKYCSGIGGRLRRFLLRKADLLVTYATSQCLPTAKLLGVERARVVYIPFGVDVDFFPGGRHQEEWNVVAAGTNSGKDYQTLVRALPPKSRCLIVTDPRNQQLAREVDTEAEVVLAQEVPIAELRNAYLGARSCVIPLRDVRFSSGQTILLEMMASGCDVIVSDASCIRDYIPDESVATVVECGDVDAMAAALRASRRTGNAAREHVRANFSSKIFGERLSEVIRSLCMQDRDH